MERTKPSPHDESPEEIGGRIIRDLLARVDPEQTLEEDLLETNARVAQQEIITLQLAMEQQKHSIRVRVAAQIEKHFQAHPLLTKEHRQSKEEAANAFVEEQIAGLKAHTKELIKAVYVIQKLREGNIRRFCRKYEPHNPSIPLPAIHTTVPAA